MNITHCQVTDCLNQDLSFWLYNGKKFCKNHYNEIFLEELNKYYSTWDGIKETPTRLKYLVGRFYDEHEIALLGKPSLTKDIVHNRSYDWMKTKNGLIFTAIRYPVSHYELGSPVFKEVHQTWEFDTNKLTFTFLS